MGRGGVLRGNLAVALALAGDRRSLSVLREIVRRPGCAEDPVGPRVYPNRMKAIPFLGRFADRKSIPFLKAIVADGARAFTVGIDTKGMFESSDDCRAEAVALAEVALERMVN